MGGPLAMAEARAVVIASSGTSGGSTERRRERRADLNCVDNNQLTARGEAPKWSSISASASITLSAFCKARSRGDPGSTFQS